MIKQLSNIKRKVKACLINKDIHYNIPRVIKKATESNITKEVVHFSAFTYQNSGDTLLPITVRDAIEINAIKSGYTWNGIKVHTAVNKKVLDEVNNASAIVIGGGGLFLKDTNENNKSGWQWPCSINNLDKIDVPIILYAVGYNRFRGQADFEPIFKEHVNAFIKKAAFFGIRNTGSINRLKEYIDPMYHNKIRLQPCPTTIISRLYPEQFRIPKKDAPFIAFNCAFDRAKLRLGEDYELKLQSIAKVAKELSKIMPIKYYVHCKPDETIFPYFDAEGVTYTVKNLQISPLEIIEEYRRPALTIGMRGHAQMIPFGCQTPILSIISHDKLKWFLDDIEHPEWGCEILSTNFETELYNTALQILENPKQIQRELAKAQDKLFEITLENSKFINEEVIY